MPANSVNDLQAQINLKSKSSATLNADNTLSVKTQTPAGVTVIHARVIVNVANQTVTIGDGSGVRTGSVDVFLSTLAL